MWSLCWPWSKVYVALGSGFWNGGIFEYKQWIRRSLTSSFCSRRFFFFALGGTLSCSSSTCALFFFLSPINIWTGKKKYRAAKRAPEVDPRPSCDVYVSYKNLDSLPVSHHSLHWQRPLSASTHLPRRSLIASFIIAVTTRSIRTDAFDNIWWHGIKYASSIGLLTEWSVMFLSGDID